MNDYVDGKANEFLKECTTGANQRTHKSVRLLYDHWALQVHGEKDSSIDHICLLRRGRLSSQPIVGGTSVGPQVLLAMVLLILKDAMVPRQLLWQPLYMTTTLYHTVSDTRKINTSPIYDSQRFARPIRRQFSHFLAKMFFNASTSVRAFRCAIRVLLYIIYIDRYNHLSEQSLK